jgi:acetyltransferase-like isoleucine patch superfamily enzyme
MRLLISLVSDVFQRFLGKVAFIAPGGGSLRPWLHRIRGAKLGKNVWIGEFVYIDAANPEALSIGDNCTIGLRTSIFTHGYRGPRRPRSNMSVVIERDVFVGPHCLILGNVRIGAGAVIKGGTVVSKHVPARALWGPPPAEILAEASIPLTPPQYTYEDFLRGLKPFSKKNFRESRESSRGEAV